MIEARLRKESPIEYRLTPIMPLGSLNSLAIAALKPEYPISIRGSQTQVDGHFHVYLAQHRSFLSEDEPVIKEVLGVAHSRRELPRRVLECALEAGRDYAEKAGCKFVYESQNGKGRVNNKQN